MENKRNELRKRMIEADLHKVSFSEKSKQNVLKRVKKDNVPSFFFVSRGLKAALSFVVCFGLLIGTAFIVKNQLAQPHQIKNHSAVSHGGSLKKIPDGQNYPAIKDPGTLTKLEIQNRMLNSRKYFVTAQGTFTEVYSSDNRSITTDYVVNMDINHYGAYCEMTKPNQGVIATEVKNSHQMITISHSSKSYLLANSNPESNTCAFHSLSPVEIASNYLADFDRWEIINQNGTLFGYKVVQIKGNLNNYNSKKHGATSFGLWVNKATGILLKLEMYDKNGNVVESLNTKSLELNKPVNQSKFDIKIPKGYTDVMKKHQEEMKADPREKDVINVAGAKNEQGNVQEVLTEIRNQFPDLYEFKGSIYFLYSDALYKYKGYYQPELYYFPHYSKNKTNSELLSVREYNKNSYARKINDFEVNFKSKPIEGFTMKGIHWEGMTGTIGDGEPRTKMTGTKGDFIYEIVGQDLTFEKVKEYLKDFLEVKPGK